MQLIGLALFVGVAISACTQKTPESPPAPQERRPAPQEVMVAPTSTITINGVGGTVTNVTPRGPQQCRPGTTAEVQLSIGGGGIGNIIEGQARCDNAVVAPVVNAADPGVLQGNNNSGGVQVQGTPACDQKYTAVAQPNSTWSVVCKF